MTALIKATSLSSLLAATQRAAKGRRQQPDVARFLMDAERECLILGQALRLPMEDPAAWQPGAVKKFTIRDPKPRHITVAPFSDRVVHHALCAELESMLERFSIYHSYACRKGRGQHRALQTAQRFARRHSAVFKGDISKFFYSVPHDRLLCMLRHHANDDPLCDRIERVVQTAGFNGRGLAIGSLVSQHLANFYLGALDHWLTDEQGFCKTLRYMDDFLVFGEKQALREMTQELPVFLSQKLGLQLNNRVSGIVPVHCGVLFLGFRVYPGTIRLAADRWRRFRRQHRLIKRQLSDGKIDDIQAAASLTSQYAHIIQFDTYRLRRDYLAGQYGEWGFGRKWREPCRSRRFFQERPAQRARGQPQQEPAIEAQRQPWFSSIELNTGGQCFTFKGGLTVDRADAVRLRIHRLSPGVDQTGVPSLRCGQRSDSWSVTKAEANSDRRGTQVWRAVAPLARY